MPDRGSAAYPRHMTIIESFDEIKQRQQTMWASGDIHAVASRIQLIAESLCEAVDLQAGWRVLDVACGSGNAALAAARCNCEAIGIDYVPALLERGRQRAAAEDLPVTLLHGDAEAIPFPNESFDAVLSVFGSMFAPHHERAAGELTRVLRLGGRLGLATWTPDGFIGEMFRVVASYVTIPPGLASPIAWGSPDYLKELFGDSVSCLEAVERTYRFRFVRADAFVDHFRLFYGPTLKAFEAAGDERAASLHADLVELVRRYAGTDGPVSIPATWLQVTATKA